MKSWYNKLFSRYLEYRSNQADQWKNNPGEYQLNTFNYLLKSAAQTSFGKKYDFSSIKSPKEYARRVPISDYENFKEDIQSMMHGASNVLWPGKTKYFAKSSGTTSDRSKYIPVTNHFLKNNHKKGAWDALASLYLQVEDARAFSAKNLLMGGSMKPYDPEAGTWVGDVSAIMIDHIPPPVRICMTPDFETALLDDWNTKIERMSAICSQEDIAVFGGVPTWTIVLFDAMMEYTGKSSIPEIWPGVQAYVHGGVGFEPYRELFKQYIPIDNFIYQEIYNASEGFFAAQDTKDDGMALLLDNAIYFEFIPEEEWESEAPIAIPLEAVERDKKYTLVMSGSNGLWRYTPGDVISFNSIRPYKMKVVGRTNQHINAFGEELMIANAEKALSKVCQDLDCSVKDFTAAPVFLSQGTKGRHQWLIEFEKQPHCNDLFAKELDNSLRKLNSDYDAKRAYDLALESLELIEIPTNTFNHWMQARGKLGGQHKVPRLSNSRKYVDQILTQLQSTTKLHG